MGKSGPEVASQQSITEDGIFGEVKSSAVPEHKKIAARGREVLCGANWEQ
jgi:hypothetical protein